MIATAMVCGALLQAGGVSSDDRAAASPPDVLVLVLDDVALSDLDAVPTPNIDRLAARGVSFRRAYAMPSCSPARYSALIGEYRGLPTGDSCGPPEHATPSDELYSLADLLVARGYATALFGKWHLGSNRVGDWERTPTLFGFQSWRAGSAANVGSCGGRNYENWTRVDEGVSARTNEYHTIAVRDALVDWWKETPAPRFAWVGFQTPHLPLHRPPAEILPEGYPKPETDREKYDAMLVSADVVVGQVLDAIDTEGTWVILLGDNGTPKMATRADQDPEKVKLTTFEDGVHVPLVFAGPGLAGGFETGALAHVVDLMATLAELVGAEIPANAAPHSRSLVPCLRDASARVRESVFCDVRNPNPSRKKKRPWRDRAVIAERWKLRRVEDRDGTTEELYDLVEDPREESPVDLSGTLEAEVAAIVEALRAELDVLEKESR